MRRLDLVSTAIVLAAVSIPFSQARRSATGMSIKPSPSTTGGATSAVSDLTKSRLVLRTAGALPSVIVWTVTFPTCRAQESHPSGGGVM